MASEPQKVITAAVVLKERFTIFPGSPLTDLATPSAQAFLVDDRREPNRKFFALIVRPGYPARINVMRALKGVECAGLMPLIDFGVLDWPPANRRVMAVIYERPMGGRVQAAITSDFRRIDEGDLVRKVITPITAALKQIRTLGVTHRAIRPTNMFWMTAEKDRVVLGDCVTTPPAFEQPAIMESTESAMCQPAGRGPGSHVDDSYSFGASLATLLHGRTTRGNNEDEVVIRQKILLGSYATVVGEERVPVQVIEVLRGLLCDDPHERWI